MPESIKTAPKERYLAVWGAAIAQLWIANGARVRGLKGDDVARWEDAADELAKWVVGVTGGEDGDEG